MKVIINKVKEENWNEFLKKTENATVYHTPQWKKVLEESFGYKPYYLFVVDDSDNILGFLPLMKVKSMLFGCRLSCLPLAHRCGYVGDSTFFEMVLDRAIKLYKEVLSKGTLEIRDTTGGHFNEVCNFSTCVLELSSNTEKVWRKLDKSSVRWAIKKSMKLGVNVEVSNNLEDIKSFYELNCQNKKKKGVPCHPLKFFKNLLKYMPQYSRLYLAKINNEIIGGGIMLFFKDTVIYGYGAAKDSMLRYHPYHAFIWEAIKDACLGGYKYFDFGRVSHDNVGLINFKKRWGTKERKLYYTYYPTYIFPSKSSFQNNKIVLKLIQHFPTWIYKIGSNWIFKQVA